MLNKSSKRNKILSDLVLYSWHPATGNTVKTRKYRFMKLFIGYPVYSVQATWVQTGKMNFFKQFFGYRTEVALTEKKRLPDHYMLCAEHLVRC